MTTRNTPQRNGVALFLMLCLSAMVAGCATTGQSSGPVTDRSGMTLYTFDKDEPGSGESACYGSCAENWPPVPAAEAGGEPFGSITRDDGMRQLTYRGHPVYYYAGDSSPGDMNGAGLGGVWHVIESAEGGDAYGSGGSGSVY